MCQIGKAVNLRQEVQEMAHYPLVIAILLAVVGGCSNFPPDNHPMNISSGELLSGQVLFGEPVTTSQLSSANILATDQAMHDWVRSKVRGFETPRDILGALVGGMVDDGLLAIEYDVEQTTTAQETFHNRRGNCLSFSNLFVALAREAGLRVSFQMVDIPPTWLRSGEMVVLNNHINILVTDLKEGSRYEKSHVVDFNMAEFNTHYSSKQVGDDYAFALYFSNRAVEAMEQSQERRAFRFLKKAIEENPRIPGVWINLGVLYSRNGYLDHAMAAYFKALRFDPANRSAMVNLAKAYKGKGDDEKAQYYVDRVSYYQERNPYFHYFNALGAYQDGQYADALAPIDKAIRLLKEEHQFYFLRGLIYYQLGDRVEAKRNMVKASELAEQEGQIKTYMQKIRALK